MRNRVRKCLAHDEFPVSSKKQQIASSRHDEQLSQKSQKHVNCVGGQSDQVSPFVVLAVVSRFTITTVAQQLPPAGQHRPTKSSPSQSLPADKDNDDKRREPETKRRHIEEPASLFCQSSDFGDRTGPFLATEQKFDAGGCRTRRLSRDRDIK
jgi:hypothetical protein